MFSELEFKKDKKFLLQFSKKLITGFDEQLEYLNNPEFFKFNSDTNILHLWELIVFFRAIKFANDFENIEPVVFSKSQKLLLKKWMIPYSKLTDCLLKLSNSLEGQVLQGEIIHLISEYLDIKIAFEILSWGGFVSLHNKVHETPNSYKYLSNLFRRFEYNNRRKENTPIDEFELKMIEILDNSLREFENYEEGKTFLLKFQKGKIEKYFAISILNYIYMPPKSMMNETKFYALVFNLFYMIFKELKWKSYDDFINKSNEKDDAKLSSYLLKNEEDSYERYKARMVKSLIKPTKEISS